jgi:hypothetical protein
MTTLLRIAFLVDAAVTAPIAWAALTGRTSWLQLLLGDAFDANRSAQRLLGVIWIALFVGLIAGVARPALMAPLLVLQLIYKALWLILAFWFRGTSDYPDPPLRMAGLFVLYVAIYPWVIPWETLFRTE